MINLSPFPVLSRRPDPQYFRNSQVLQFTGTNPFLNLPWSIVRGLHFHSMGCITAASLEEFLPARYIQPKPRWAMGNPSIRSSFNMSVITSPAATSSGRGLYSWSCFNTRRGHTGLSPMPGQCWPRHARVLYFDLQCPRGPKPPFW